MNVIRNIYEDLIDTADFASEMLGSLDRILEEMQDVEKDLEAGRLTDETLRRQEKRGSVSR